MLTRITLDKMNERYAGVYYSPRPSELPSLETVRIVRLSHKQKKKILTAPAMKSTIIGCALPSPSGKDN
ncbi:uncharacterized protein Eint_111615 [Encephalitozoon intestinalis ATCC 50506]|uniref:Plus3 domain-containing protein n=1 Tax=Encephalitozoon intestinalis (strain ATCC 50506) TaxID=876142 RepID=W8Q236_ENCIT|nr:uncharacterized protein Eint_111615 [Encephalitozoon intestinalis ATCC 50506]AHL30174.1 hypothetical protein Eint_111615 [Encephalitozoon intestinalis ATCC 50506]UTX46521.1 hypothetical protein GPK93_11g21320 [Encephalitozoon intestinalis]